MRVFALQCFSVIISIIPKINLDWSVNKDMKDADVADVMADVFY